MTSLKRSITTPSPEHEPMRYLALRTERHIIKRKLDATEIRTHANKVLDLDAKIEGLKSESTEAKEFVARELFQSDPVTRRSRDHERAIRAGILAADKKRAEHERDRHLHAAADGFEWVDVDCEIVADDVESMVFMKRIDTREEIWSRPMSEDELAARKKRKQLDLPKTKAKSPGEGLPAAH